MLKKKTVNELVSNINPQAWVKVTTVICKDRCAAGH
jgi:hypothetical protein